MRPSRRARSRFAWANPTRRRPRLWVATVALVGAACADGPAPPSNDVFVPWTAAELRTLEHWRPGQPPEAAAPPVGVIDRGARATVLVFLDVECPIANAMAPELERLRRTYEPEGFAFRHVYPDGTRDRAAIDAHAAAYALGAMVVRDPDHRLVDRCGATIAPEAAIVVDGELVYRGRVDDRAPELGARRPAPRSRDLDRALAALLNGRRPDPDRTEAVGCHLVDLRAPGERR